MALSPIRLPALGSLEHFKISAFFKDLSVLDNILIAMDNYLKKKSHSILASLFRTRSAIQTELDLVQRAIELLKIFKLKIL